MSNRRAAIGTATCCEGLPMTPPRRPFILVDNEILDRMAEIGVGPMAVLLQLLRHRNRRTGQCNPSHATMSRITGLDRSTVIRYTQKLVDSGWITKCASWAQEGAPLLQLVRVSGLGRG